MDVRVNALRTTGTGTEYGGVEMNDMEQEHQCPQDAEATSAYVYRTIDLGENARVIIGASTKEEVQSIAQRLGYEDRQS